MVGRELRGRLEGQFLAVGSVFAQESSELLRLRPEIAIAEPSILLVGLHPACSPASRPFLTLA